MKENLKETVYQTQQWNAKPEGFSLRSGTEDCLYDLELEQRNQNTASQYNEMLKNTIDFSESLNTFTAKQDEDFFFADHWPRKEICLMRTSSKQKLFDLFKSDEGFECGASFGNEGSILLDASDHDYSHPICLDETKSMENGLNGDDLSNAILGNQFSQLRLSSYNYGAASGMSNDFKEASLQSKVETEHQQGDQRSQERPQSNTSKGQKSQRPFVFNEEDPSLELSLKNGSEASGIQTISTRNSIESSLHSPDSLKKWTEVSISLYSNRSHRSESESEEVSLRLRRKKKKTENAREVDGHSKLNRERVEESSHTNSFQLSSPDEMSLEEHEKEESHELNYYNYSNQTAFRCDQDGPREQENTDFDRNEKVSKNARSPRCSRGKRKEASSENKENTESSILCETSESIQLSNSLNECHQTSRSQSPSQKTSFDSNPVTNNRNSLSDLSSCPLPGSASSYPRLSMETVITILNQFEPKDLLGNLPITPEILEEIERSNIISKIKNANQKRIGPLSVEERKIKVERFFEKRKQRSWNKRINYQCRKEVADSRLRIKGRFVTRNQARVLLGDEYNIDSLSTDQIRELLHKKFEEGSGYKIQNIDLVLKNHQKNRFGSKHC